MSQVSIHAQLLFYIILINVKCVDNSSRKKIINTQHMHSKITNIIEKQIESNKKPSQIYTDLLLICLNSTVVYRIVGLTSDSIHYRV